ncbi:hypothetical protein l11_11670 [Neisseria weaveri LMG 5135]|nr:hypothetical protein l11_11670 [Neisseria weaveri LMG 5135]
MGHNTAMQSGKLPHSFSKPHTHQTLPYAELYTKQPELFYFYSTPRPSENIRPHPNLPQTERYLIQSVCTCFHITI